MDDNVETPDFYVRKSRSRTGVLRIDVCEKRTNRVLLTCKVRQGGFISKCSSAVREAMIEALRTM